MEIACGDTVRVTPAEVRASRLFSNWASRIEDWDIPRVIVADAFSRDGAIRMLLLRITYGAYDQSWAKVASPNF